METFIVYIDDKQYALQQIVPMLSHQEASKQVSWVLVGCPPRLTRHSGRWLSQSAQKKMAARLDARNHARNCNLVETAKQPSVHQNCTWAINGIHKKIESRICVSKSDRCEASQINDQPPSSHGRPTTS